MSKYKKKNTSNPTPLIVGRLQPVRPEAKRNIRKTQGENMLKIALKTAHRNVNDLKKIGASHTALYLTKIGKQ